MSRLRFFLVITAILSSNTIFAQVMQKEAKELSNLRLVCVSNKATTPYMAIKTAKQPLSNGESTTYTFGGKPYKYTFTFSIQGGSENRYIVKVRSDELDSKKNPIEMTATIKTFYVNTIRKNGEYYTSYHPVTKKNITQEEYNQLNTMQLTYLNCWLFDADHWGF